MDTPAFFHIREKATVSDHRNVRNRGIPGSQAASAPNAKDHREMLNIHSVSKGYRGLL